MVDYAQPVVYRINAADIIEDVNDAWVRFAIENGASHLATEVVGKSLWDYIAGDVVNRIYKAVLKGARAKKQTVSFPFRCDSPSLYRGMRLFVVPLDEERLEFRAVFETVVAQPKTLDILIPSRTNKPEPALPLCSWCKAIAIGTEWKPIEKALEELRLFNRELRPSFRHDICASCLSAFLLDYEPEEKSLAVDIQAYITLASRWFRQGY